MTVEPGLDQRAAVFRQSEIRQQFSPGASRSKSLISSVFRSNSSTSGDLAPSRIRSRSDSGHRPPSRYRPNSATRQIQIDRLPTLPLRSILPSSPRPDGFLPTLYRRRWVRSISLAGFPRFAVQQEKPVAGAGGFAARLTGSANRTGRRLSSSRASTDVVRAMNFASRCNPSYVSSFSRSVPSRAVFSAGPRLPGPNGISSQRTVHDP